MALTVTPGVGDTLNSTQAPIQANFGTINAAFLVDHVEYNLGDQGKHSKSTYVAIADPADVPGSTDIAVYNKLVGVVPTMFFKLLDGGTPTPLSNADVPTFATNGQTILPSGLIIKWGGFLANGLQHAWPVANFPTAVLSATATVYNPPGPAPLNGTAWIVSYNLVGITVSTMHVNTGVPENMNIKYIAIGY